MLTQIETDKDTAVQLQSEHVVSQITFHSYCCLILSPYVRVAGCWYVIIEQSLEFACRSKHATPRKARTYTSVRYYLDSRLNLHAVRSVVLCCVSVFNHPSKHAAKHEHTQ